MKIRFFDVAHRELDEAVAWYDEREEDLGLAFLDELDALFAVSSPPHRLRLKSNLELEGA